MHKFNLQRQPLHVLAVLQANQRLHTQPQEPSTRSRAERQQLHQAMCLQLRAKWQRSRRRRQKRADGSKSHRPNVQMREVRFAENDFLW